MTNGNSQKKDFLATEDIQYIPNTMGKTLEKVRDTLRARILSSNSLNDSVEDDSVFEAYEAEARVNRLRNGIQGNVDF